MVLLIAFVGAVLGIVEIEGLLALFPGTRFNLR
jgi:hypothetical protein